MALVIIINNAIVRLGGVNIVDLPGKVCNCTLLGRESQVSGGAHEVLAALLWSGHYVDVETHRELTRGMTVVDRLNVAADECNRTVWGQVLNGRKSKVCWSIDNRRWKEALYAALR